MHIEKLMDLGARLKERRCALGLEREEIAVKLKISSKTLHALEEALADALPQPIFAAGFARSYAESLGMDMEEINKLLTEAFPREALDNINPDLSSLAREQSITINQTSNTKAALLIVPVLLLLAAGLLWGVYYVFGEDIRELLNIPASPRLSQAVTPAASAAPPEAGPLQGQNQGPQAEAPAAVESAAPAPAPQAEAEAPAAPIFALSRHSNAVANSPIPPGSKRVALFAKAECWIGTDYDDSGANSFVLEAGQSFVLDFKTRLKLILGNAGVIDMSYNGKAYPINGRFREAKVINLP